MKLKFTTIVIALSLVTFGLQGAMPAYAAQTAAPVPTAQDNEAKLKPLWDAFLKARQEKDWGKCLEIAEECKLHGAEGLKANEFMRFSIFMRSGDEKHADEFISGLIREGMKNATTFIEFYAADPKGMSMLDKTLKTLDTQATQLKLTKLKTLMLGDNPTEYVAFAKQIMEGPDQNNAPLVNKIAWYIVCPDSESKKEVENTYRKDFMGVGADGKGAPIGIYTNLKHPASFKTPAMYALAKKAIDRANKLTAGKNGDFMDTLGWTYYRLGDMKKAYEAEMKAVTLKKGDSFGSDKCYQVVADWFKTQ